MFSPSFFLPEHTSLGENTLVSRLIPKEQFLDRNTSVKNFIQCLSQRLGLPENCPVEVDGSYVTFPVNLPKETEDSLKFLLTDAFEAFFTIITPAMQPVPTPLATIIQALYVKLQSLKIPSITLYYKDHCCSFYGEISTEDNQKLKTEFARFIGWYKPNGKTISLNYDSLSRAPIENPAPLMAAYARHCYYQAAPAPRPATINVSLSTTKATQAHGLRAAIPYQGNVDHFLKDVLKHAQNLLDTPIDTSPNDWSLFLDGNPINSWNVHHVLAHLIKFPDSKWDICFNVDKTPQSTFNLTQ